MQSLSPYYSGPNSSVAGFTLTQRYLSCAGYNHANCNTINIPRITQLLLLCLCSRRESTDHHQSSSMTSARTALALSRSHRKRQTKRKQTTRRVHRPINVFYTRIKHTPAQSHLHLHPARVPTGSPAVLPFGQQHTHTPNRVSASQFAFVIIVAQAGFRSYRKRITSTQHATTAAAAATTDISSHNLPAVCLAFAFVSQRWLCVCCSVSTQRSRASGGLESRFSTSALCLPFIVCLRLVSVCVRTHSHTQHTRR